jgi:hypothetical protein
MLLMAPHDAGNFISQLEIRGKELCVICFNEFFCMKNAVKICPKADEMKSTENLSPFKRPQLIAVFNEAGKFMFSEQ